LFFRDIRVENLASLGFCMIPGNFSSCQEPSNGIVGQKNCKHAKPMGSGGLWERERSSSHTTPHLPVPALWRAKKKFSMKGKNMSEIKLEKIVRLPSMSPIKMPDHELWMAFFLDPSNNTLALMSEVPYV
jgi:hypothetical protein